MEIGRELEVVEGDPYLINLSSGPEAFPFPTEYQWRKNGEAISNTSTLTLGYPTAHFLNVSRTESGLYSLDAVNHQLDDPSDEIGRGNGSFQLHVLCKFLP